MHALIHGRIRSAADKPWMEFTGEQVTTYGPWPERFLTMDATMAHLPVDVLHVFAGNSATMRVKPRWAARPRARAGTTTTNVGEQPAHVVEQIAPKTNWAARTLCPLPQTGDRRQ